MCVLTRYQDENDEWWLARDPSGYRPNPQATVDLCWDGNTWMPSDNVWYKTGHTGRSQTVSHHPATKYRQGQLRREQFLVELAEKGSIKEACAAVGVTVSTWEKWKNKYPEFRARAQLARRSEQEGVGFTGDFATFRHVYFGMETTWFQQAWVEALESCKPGEIILILCPPEHGKSTTLEDFIGYKLALDPTCRIAVISERQQHGIKMIRRVKHRMSPDGPTPAYVARFGPFVPDENQRGDIRQPWAADHFDVRRRGVFDERDYNVAAAGITTGIQGTRSDWLIVDDIQSLKSLNLTDSYVDILRQDFFSRPGMFGRICLVGTRTGAADVYERLIDEELIDRLHVFPAHDGEGKWLWPERYTAAQYEAMRKRVGEQAWFRNYMQKPSAARDATFTTEMVAGCTNPARSVIADAPKQDGQLTPVTVTLDPALGGANALMAWGLHPQQMVYLSSRVDHGLTRTEQIFDLVEQMILRWNQPNVSAVTEVVIEQNNFQRGLLDDDRMREIIRRYGVRVVPHQSGINKMDPNIGIPAMALAFIRHEVDLPYADEPSRREVDLLREELCSWRPYRSGKRLVQDRVMCMWFGFLRWRSTRAVAHVDKTAFASRPSPLHLPARMPA